MKYIKNFSFPKKLKLLTSKDFSYVLQKSKRIKNSKTSLFSYPNQLNYPRIGIIISKKNIKYAYQRNQIKRQIRETFRKHQHKLLKNDFIIIIHKQQISKLNKNYSLIQELKKSWYYDIHR